MSHEINLPFEQFEKYNLSLTIIAKQRELIELMHHRNNADKIKAAEKAIRLMIEKLIKESDNDVEVMILNRSENRNGL